MKYRVLGRSGLKVSELCLGTMTFGEDWGFGASKEESRKQFDIFAAAGGNFIDTANVYTKGTSERFVGEFVKSRSRPFRGGHQILHRHPVRRHQCVGQLAQESRAVGRCLLAAARSRSDRPVLGACGRFHHSGRRVDARARRRGAGGQGDLRGRLRYSGLAGGSGQYPGRTTRLESVSWDCRSSTA
jgi:hypothetical protein